MHPNGDFLKLICNWLLLLKATWNENSPQLFSITVIFNSHLYSLKSF